MSARTSWLDPHSPVAALARIDAGEPAPKPLWLRWAPGFATALLLAGAVSVFVGPVPLLAVSVLFVAVHEIGDR